MTKSTKTKIAKGELFQALIGGIVGGVLSIAVIKRFGGSSPDGKKDASGALLGVLAGIFAGAAISFIVHEMGHAVAGWLVGRRLRAMAFGPVWFTRGTNGWQVRFMRAKAGIGGLVVSFDPRDDRGRAGRDAVFYVGGCAANFLFAALLAPLLWIDGLPQFLAAFLATMAALSAIIGVVNLVPFRVASGFESDGRQLLDLARGGRHPWRRATRQLLHAHLADVRPREWIEADVRSLDSAPPDTRDAALAKYLLYARALDTGDAVTAGTRLDESLPLFETFVPVGYGSLCAEAAWFAAFHRNDLDAAKKHREAATGPMLERHELLLADASIARLQGESAEAVRLAREALDAWHKPLLHASTVMRERIEALLDPAPLSTQHAPASAGA